MEQVLPGWFTAEELLLHRMETFHRERVHAVAGGEAPFALKKGPMLVVHLIPSESVRSRRRFSATDLASKGTAILPLGEQSGNRRFNADGYATCESDGAGKVGAYSQLFRDGRLEAVWADAVYEQQESKLLRDHQCERAILDLVGQYLGFSSDIGIDPPYWLFTALVGCVGVRASTTRGIGSHAIDRPLVFLPEFQVEASDGDSISQLRPLFDCVANSVGLSRSQNFDEKGNPIQRRGW